MGYLPPVLLPLLTLATVTAQTLPSGLPVERALGLHVTNGGLAHMGDVIEGIVPPTMPVTDISGEFACDEEDANPLAFALGDMDIELAAQDVALVASEGRLDLTVFLTLQSTPAELAVTGDCTFLVDMDEVCLVELDVTSATLHIGMEMALADEGVEVTVDDVSMEMSPIRNPLDDCTLANAIGTLLGQNEMALTNLILSMVEPELEGVGEDIEIALEDALDALYIDTELSLGDAVLQLVLEPSALTLDASGLMLGMSATVFGTAPSDCVEAGSGSDYADDPWPPISETAMTSSLPYDAAILMGKDFLDHVLWNVWTTGALCIELEELGAGLPLSTDVLGPFMGESFAELFPESQPVALQVAPSLPPVASFHEDGAPVSIDLHEFGLQLHALLDDRLARIFRVDVEAEVGIEPGVSSDMLAPELIIDPDDMEFVETVNELLEPGFSDGLADLLPTVLDLFLPTDLLPTMELPTVMGVGLEEVFWVPSDDGRWIGGYALLDTEDVEPIELAGCDSTSLGCDGGSPTGGFEDLLDFEALLGCGEGSSGCGGEGSGCDSATSGCEGSGCATGGRIPAYPFGRLMMLATALTLLVVRRRD